MWKCKCGEQLEDQFDSCWRCGLSKGSKSNKSESEVSDPIVNKNKKSIITPTVQSINGNEVVVVNVKMPFWSMVTFLVKLAIASVPAAIIIFLIFIGLTAVFGGIFGSFLNRGY